MGVIDVIFEADSFDELISQLDMMERLGNSDVDTVHAIAAYKRDIKDRRFALEADQKAAAKLVVEREEHKNELIALQADLQASPARSRSRSRSSSTRRSCARSWRCTGYSGPIPGPVDPNSPGHPDIVSIAQRYFGVPYVWGGAGPGGFDCSGLTMYCYAQIGIGMSHGATDQQRSSIPVALTDLRPGDLIFFGNASFSHHVAIFVRAAPASRRRTPATWCATVPGPAATPGSAAASRSERAAARRAPGSPLRRHQRDRRQMRRGGKLLRGSAELGHGERTRATGAAR